MLFELGKSAVSIKIREKDEKDDFLDEICRQFSVSG